VTPTGVILSWEEYQELKERAESRHDRELSTVEAADEFGRSRSYWARAASDGEIEGAYRDGRNWRLRESACEAHLAEKQREALGRRRQRGPWQTVGDGSSDLPQGKVLEGRFAPLGRAANGAEKSAVAWLAGERRTDGAGGGR